MFNSDEQPSVTKISKYEHKIIHNVKRVKSEPVEIRARDKKEEKKNNTISEKFQDSLNMTVINEDEFNNTGLIDIEEQGGITKKVTTLT